MKTSSLPSFWAARLLAVVAVVIGMGTLKAEAASRWATLEAIHKLENPRNLTRRGAHGELGAYQFKPSTWRMHTNEPFERALERSMSDVVAVKHYEWLKRRLEEARLPATPYNIALAWNGGIGAVIRGTSPMVAHRYAERAATLAALFDDNSRRLASDTR